MDRDSASRWLSTASSVEVSPGEVMVLLGIDGAGKTTLLEAISGMIAAAKGAMRAGRGRPAPRPAGASGAGHGLGHVEQGRRIFRDLTTEENLLVAGHEDWSIDEAFALFPPLKPRPRIRAGPLSEAASRPMLVVAGALAARPKILMADELSLGLSPGIATALVTTMRTLADGGLGILLVEQFAALALQVGDQAHVLSQGQFAYRRPVPGAQGRPRHSQARLPGRIGERTVMARMQSATGDTHSMTGMWRQMLRIRRFDEAATRLLQRGEMAGVLHNTTGQEAGVVGACVALPDDLQVGGHRNHGHPIARGADLDR